MQGSFIIFSFVSPTLYTPDQWSIHISTPNAPIYICGYVKLCFSYCLKNPITALSVWWVLTTTLIFKQKSPSLWSHSWPFFSLGKDKHFFFYTPVPLYMYLKAAVTCFCLSLWEFLQGRIMSVLFLQFYFILQCLKHSASLTNVCKIDTVYNKYLNHTSVNA